MKRITEKDLRNKNIAVMFRTTAITMILTELTGVIAEVKRDGSL